jgi:hypothetical protein
VDVMCAEAIVFCSTGVARQQGERGEGLVVKAHKVKGALLFLWVLFVVRQSCLPHRGSKARGGKALWFKPSPLL